TLYRQAIALDPLRANFHLALADQLYRLGRQQEAKAALERAQALNSQLSSLHLVRSQIDLTEGRQQEAITEIEKETGDWQKLSGEALAYSAAHRREDSDQALNQLIANYHKECA